MSKLYCSLTLLFLVIIKASGHQPLGFTENKGQIHDQNNSVNASVRYMFSGSGLNVQLKANSFSYDSYTSQQIQNFSKVLPGNKAQLNTKLLFHRIDIEFINANLNPEIVAEGESPSHTNYIVSNKNISNIKSFSKITYKSLYPNIDLEFVTVNGKIKYNFIIHKGGDVSQIKWIYLGADNSIIKNKNIELSHSNGNITETIPESYILTGSKNKTLTKVSYKKIDGNVFGFNTSIKTLNSNETFVIDPSPNLDWGTYYGSANDEAGNSTAVDPAGNVVLAGQSNSSTNIATTGAFQVIYGGGTNDAFVAKFNSAGALQWCTYYGGNGDDNGLSVAVTNGGLIYLAGQTTSTASIATGGAHQTAYGGLFDAFLVKLDGTGSMLWATYYGGATYDSGNAVATDALGNAFLIGFTDSPTQIASGGAFQTGFNGIYDAFVVKFNPAGTRLWGTYFGGAGDDYGLSAATDNIGNIYFSGQTASSSSLASVGAHQPVWGGNNDAFIAKFNTSGGINWATYYGASGSETSFACTTDASGNAYLGGQTTSTTAIATAGAQQTLNVGGTSDAFVAKFNSLGVRQWGTYFGDGGNDAINSMVCDAALNIYVTGGTTSGINIATPNCPQLAFGGVKDAFVVKLNSSSIQQWGTYYGGGGDDFGTGIAYDGTSKFFISGTASSVINIATAGAYQTSKGGSYDAFLARFANGCINPVSPGNTTTAANLTVCSGKTTTLSASGTGTVTWFNAATGGTFLASGSLYVTPSLTANTTFYAQDSSACGASLARTAINVTVNPSPTASFNLPVLDTLVCLTRNAFTITGGSPAGGVYSGSGVSGSAFTASVAGVGTYSLTYTFTNSFGCGASAQSQIRVYSCAGINELHSQPIFFSIYPNPNNGEFTIKSSIAGNFEIVNELGQIIRSLDINATINSQITVSGLPSGTYFINGKSGSGLVRQKLVVLK